MEKFDRKQFLYKCKACGNVKRLGHTYSYSEYSQFSEYFSNSFMSPDRVFSQCNNCLLTGSSSVRLMIWELVGVEFYN